MPERLRITVLTGAGISAESGISVFRNTDVNERGQALWENHPVDEVAHINAWVGENKARMLAFYNERRRACNEPAPNDAHRALARLAEYHDVTLVTQNIDDLHERGGSENVIHLHGSLNHARPEFDDETIIPWSGDINIGDLHEDIQLRPHIVWFGEGLYGWEQAIISAMTCDLLIVIGTSLNVYPAATLVTYANSPIIIVDPNPPALQSQFADITFITEPASVGVPQLVQSLIESPQSEHVLSSETSD